MQAGAEILLTPGRLAELIARSACVVVDCRFELADKNRGRTHYLNGHIPGAQYAHLDHDLAAPVSDSSGRHPLPSARAFAVFLGRIGWDRSKLLVAHDERNNAVAARLWWLMRYFGQPSALLDGGLDAWTRAGYPLETGEVESAQVTPPGLQANPDMTVDADAILESLEQFTLNLVDARVQERFTGATEPLDTRAGHIPGALNRPFGLNLDESGSFKPPEQLRGEFAELLGQRPAASVVHTCGSGVTACHNHLAMELAGLEGSRIYPGSWSEWVRDDARPIAVGP